VNARHNRIEVLFDEARGLASAEWPAFLAGACDDEPMRRELLSLLAAHEEAAGFLDSLAHSVISPAWEGLQDSLKQPDPLGLEGHRIGAYTVMEHLGVGGMGVVYRAKDERLGRPVALKFLWPHLAADAEADRRFVQEARASSRLDHANIATIYEISVAEDGLTGIRRRFIAMAYCEGRTLKEMIVGGALPAEQALDYAVQITAALQCAHEAGLVHRDVKPANVIVTPDNVLKLVDFGLAKAAAASSMTMTGRRMGTAAYMSPEQARGDQVDARSDLWSVGVLLFEMLTGTRPFSRNHDTATLYAILHEAPPPLGSLRPSLPLAFDQIVERCLAKGRDARYPSAEALLQDLRAARRGETLAPLDAPGAGTPLQKRSIAVLPFDTLGLSEPTPFTLGIHGDILTRLSNVGQLQVISRTSVRQYQNTGKSIREIGRELDAAWVLEGEIQESAELVRVNVRLIDTAADRPVWASVYQRTLTSENLFAIQGEITREIAAALEAQLTPEEENRIGRAPTENIAAYRLYAQGRGWLDQRTEVGMSRAANYFRRAIAEDPDYALAWVGLADALALLHDYGYLKAEQTLPEAADAIRRALDLDPHLAEAYASLGILNSNRHEGSAAIRELNRAVELRPGYAEAHNWLAWVHLLLGHGSEALANARRGVELDPLSPEAVSNLALASLVVGDTDAALREARRAAEIQADYETPIFYLGLALHQMGKYTEAQDVLSGLVVPWAGVGPLATLALIQIAIGENEQARELVQTLEEAGELFAAGLLHAALGDVNLAFEAFGRVGYWDSWPSIAAHLLYPDVLDPLRKDPRFAEVLGALEAEWGIHSEAKATRRTERRSKPPDRSAARLCVEGRAHLHERTEPAFHHAEACFRQALNTDDKYAPAWSGLADALSLIAFYGCTPTNSSISPQEAAHRAVALNPDLGEAQISAGIVHALHHDAPAALRAFERAVDLHPSSAEAYVWLAWIHLIIGQPEQALEPSEQGVNLNPLAPPNRVFRAEALLANGAATPALRESRRAREIQPTYGIAHYMEGLALDHLGQPEAAIAALERALALAPNVGALPSSEVEAVLLAMRTRLGAQRQTDTEDLTHPFAIGMVQAGRGNLDKAFQAFRGVRGWGLTITNTIRYFLPHVLNPLRADHRFGEIRRQIDQAWRIRS
jgi:serine/threonine protein kinase/tetratricopeptide (TPR) repeat protein